MPVETKSVSIRYRFAKLLVFRCGHIQALPLAATPFTTALNCVRLVALRASLPLSPVPLGFAPSHQHGWGLVEDTALKSSSTLGANPHACWFRDLAPGWFVGLYPARRLQQIWQYAQNDRKRYGHCTNQNLFCQCFFVHFYLLGLGQFSGGTTTHQTAL